MNKLKAWWHKFEGLPTWKKFAVIGGVIALLVLALKYFTKGNDNTQLTYSQDTNNQGISAQNTTGSSGGGTYRDDSQLISAIKGLQSENAAQNQATLSYLNDLSHNQTAQLTGSPQNSGFNWGSVTPLLASLGGNNGNSGGMGGLLGGNSSRSSSGDFGALGYNSGDAYNGSLGYSATGTSNLVGRLANSSIPGAGLLSSLFGTISGTNLYSRMFGTDNTSIANQGLDRTGVFAQNFGGLPAGVSEQQAVDAMTRIHEYQMATQGNSLTSNWGGSFDSGGIGGGIRTGTNFGSGSGVGVGIGGSNDSDSSGGWGGGKTGGDL